MSQCILVQSLSYTTIGRTIVIIYAYICSTSDASACMKIQEQQYNKKLQGALHHYHDY